MIPESSSAREGAEFLFSQSRHRPRVGLILGSGLGAAAGSVEDAESIPYAVIPNFPQPTVEGHSGELVFGRLGGQPVAVLRGRVHLYEGFSPAQIAFPVRLLRALGCDLLVVTNAAGALNPSYRTGDLMLIRDHIFVPGMAGFSPLMGPHDQSLGPRFVDLSNAYDANLRGLAQSAAIALGIALHEGVYLMLAGPHFETPSEVHLLHSLGGDAVGMSTCPEVVVARQAGMRVLGISTVTNAAAGHGEGEIDHRDVLRVAAEASNRVVAIVERTLSQLDP